MPRRPGPSVAGSIWPVRSTASPTRTPCVSSYICASARRPVTRSTSPLSWASPKRTKMIEFFIIGALLSMLTMFPVIPATLVSGIGVGMFTQGLGDERLEDRAAALCLHLLPVMDQLPARDVQHHRLEAEVILVRALLQPIPRCREQAPLETNRISLLEQAAQLGKVGEGMSEAEVGFLEVAADVVIPLTDPDARWTEATASPAQCVDDHARVHGCMCSLAGKRVPNPAHQLSVLLH